MLAGYKWYDGMIEGYTSRDRPYANWLMRILSIPFAIRIEIERKEKSLLLDVFKKTNNVNNNNNNNNKERKKNKR